MRVLDPVEFFQVHGGDACYEAYAAVAKEDNPGAEYLLGMMLLGPFFLLGKIPQLMAERQTLEAICGGSAAYDKTKAAYCSANPDYYRCKPPRQSG